MFVCDFYFFIFWGGDIFGQALCITGDFILYVREKKTLKRIKYSHFTALHSGFLLSPERSALLQSK